MPENIFLDGQGSFNHSTKNAGTIKWGEFNNAAVNTGAIVLSAVFTGTAVNSGTIGDLMPVYATSVFKANSGNWESTYSTVQTNSATWGQGGGGSSDWDSITNKPTEFTPTTHTHHASAINAGVLDPARIPVINTSIQVIVSNGELADLTNIQQDEVIEGAIVTTSSGYRYLYTGAGSKTDAASYIQLADITPDWSVVANKPSEFTPISHTHSVSEINGLGSVVTWVTTNSGSVDPTLGNSAYSTVQSNSATWGQGGGGSSDWDSITNKPTEFNPSAHTHAVSSVNGLQPVVTWVTTNSGSVDPTLGNSAYSTVQSNSANWNIPNWNDITDVPTEFNPSAHTHHASAINAGVLDPARIPVINTSIQVISQGGIGDLTVAQQNTIVQGAIVTTTDGQRYVYVSGSKTSTSSYITLADVTPDWTVIANKPSTFAPSSHTHAVSSVDGLQPVVTWVASNSSAPAIINYIFDNGTAPILANTKGNITLPSGFKITEWQVLSDLVTTSTLYLNKATFDSYPTMTFYGEMALSNGRKASGSFTGVDNLSANDILEFAVITNSASTKLTISIKGYKI
jgi:hypothetical protein